MRRRRGIHADIRGPQTFKVGCGVDQSAVRWIGVESRRPPMSDELHRRQSPNLAASVDETAAADLFKEFLDTMDKPIISQEVHNTIAQRSILYGEPLQCMTALAALWGVHLEQTWNARLPKPLTAKDAALMLVLLKVLRATRAFNEDN